MSMNFIYFSIISKIFKTIKYIVTFMVVMVEDDEEQSEESEGEEIEEETTETEPETQEEEFLEEPCDPITMNCDEMRDKILELSSKKSEIDRGIKSLEETKKIIPSESINKAYNETLLEKQKVDDEIYNLFEKFTVCTRKPSIVEEENKS